MRVPGKVNWLAAALMSVGICCVLIAVSETTTWGWGSPKTLVLLVRRLRHLRSVGLRRGAQPRAADRHGDDAHPRRVDDQPAAFLLGAGMYSSFIIFPQFAQLRRHRLRVRRLGRRLRPLPAALGAGDGAARDRSRVASRAGSGRSWRSSLGSGITATAFLWFAAVHSHPIDMLISAALLGVGIGLAFAALGNLIVQAVPPHQTGVASGMNTVMRTLGGALGGQIAGDLHRRQHASRHAGAGGLHRVLPARGGFLVVCTLAALLVPSTRPTREEVPVEGQLVSVQEAG